MIQDDAERLIVLEALRSAGFSHAWELRNSDESEAILLVPASELTAEYEREVEYRIMELLPGRKVWVAPFKASAPTMALY